MVINPLNAELNPMCHPLALLGAHHILHVSRIRVNPYMSVGRIPLHDVTTIISVTSKTFKNELFLYSVIFY